MLDWIHELATKYVRMNDNAALSLQDVEIKAICSHGQKVI